jgi:SAM-dependent methyltransferase
MRSWVEYWDSDPAIYVNQRHKQVHAVGIARDLRRAAGRAGLSLLDYGCGEALYAEAIAGDFSRIVLTDAAATVRTALEQRVAGHENLTVTVTGLIVWHAPFDLILVNSVVQYLSPEQFRALLSNARGWLAPGGRLLIADVIPPGVSPLTDATALLRFGWREGFLLGAFAGLVKTALSDYSSIRKGLGFSQYSEADMIAELTQAGFASRRVQPNFGHNQARMTFEATPV